MITKKEDLINTYIENDHGELRDLYLAKCEEFGICADDIDKNSGTIGVLDRCDISMWHSLMERTIEKCKKLTLSDLKPRTRFEYEKVTESIFDLRDEFERGELYFDRDRCTGGIYVSSDQYQKIRDMNDFSQAALNNNIYRKVEKEIDWRDEADSYFLKTKYLGIDCTIEEAITRSDYCDEFLELCRVALRANGEIE